MPSRTILRGPAAILARGRVATDEIDCHIQGVKPDTQRRALIAVLVLGGSAIGIDRLVLGAGLSGPAVAAAALENVTKACEVERVELVSLASESSVADRLEGLRDYVKDKEPSEAFAACGQGDTRVEKVPASDEPSVHELIALMKPQLGGISTGPGERRLASVRFFDFKAKEPGPSAKALRVGDCVLGAVVSDITEREVVFSYRDQTFHVTLAEREHKPDAVLVRVGK